MIHTLSDGRTFGLSDKAGPAELELSRFHYETPEARFYHLKRFIDHFYNERFPNAYYWNDWTELMQQEFCRHDWVTLTGSASSWKTTSAAIHVVVRWLASPNDTVVVLTSTTRDGLRRRIWKEITRYYNLDPAVGHLIQSKDCIQFAKGSDDAGIFGIALDKGEIDKAIGKIIGFHAPHVIVVVDEMPYTSEAIVNACVNLRSGTTRFQFIGIGNADDQLDPHGKMCEPKNGWDSILPETQTWETKRGICVHLDGQQSPNVRAGKILYPGMFNQQDIDETVEFYGRNSPQYWQMVRGFWAPEGLARTVLSHSILTKFHAFDKPIWIKGFSQGAVLDPSFEGEDRCVLRFPRCGEIEDEAGQPLLAIDFGETQVIKPDQPLTEEPLHYQIVRQVRAACEEHNVGPEMFGLDSTGEGGGLAAIFAREWSPNILQIEFGGRASKDRTVSQINPRKCSDEYYNFVTELWFGVRTLVQNGQARGLDTAAAQEFCKRLFRKQGMLTQVETKKEMKARVGRSPDFADTAAMAVELFRRKKGLMTMNGRISQQAEKDWLKFAVYNDVASDETNYTVDSFHEEEPAYEGLALDPYGGS